MSDYDQIWSNDFAEGDDEETAKLKQRLARAEAELAMINEEKEQEQKEYSSRKVKRKKDSNKSWAENLGYDKEAHEKMKTEGGLVERVIEDPKKRMGFFIAVIVLAVVVCVAKFFIG